MKNYFDTIILSPHLDDAALSCGGYIYEQTLKGEAILVVTFMAGLPPQTPFSPFAQQMHDRWELASQIVEQRRNEDIIACQILKADYLHGDIPDAIYRLGSSEKHHFYTSDEALFGSVHPDDAKRVISQIGAILSKMPPHSKVIAPLTVGNHVDHQLVRMAVEQHGTAALLYYEDYPYARAVGAVETVMANDSLNFEYKLTSLSAEALKIKAKAIAAFHSQMSTFFNGRSDIDAQISAYAAKVGGERYWRRTLN